MTRKPVAQKGFLTRLLHNQAGNTLALTAAAIIPLIGMIGGAVDMSRAYLTKSRLQQACDAGALAGRREMSNGSWTSAAQTTANKFFDANFEDGSYGTSGRTRTYTESSQTVTGNASVTVPMTVMKMFGFTPKTLNVTCTAEMKIPNTDVMFVLDTTGSMDWTLSGDTKSKIEALRDAVESFYTTLESSKGSNTQIRYGFVPYSVNVNVGKLLKNDWMVDNATYQSREPNMYTASSVTTETYQETETYNNKKWCTNWANGSSNDFPSNSVPGTFFGTTYSYSYASYNNWTDECVRNVTKTTATYTKTDNGTVFVNWTYKPISYDVSGLKAGGSSWNSSITANVGSGGSSKTISWNGCIEERQSVAISSSYSTAPSGANDLDIDLLPDTSDDTTRWRPALADLVFGRPNTSSTGTWYSSDTDQKTYSGDYYSPSAYCPVEARKLDEISSTDLTAYLDSLNPTGSTYHDIGMLWGARLISPDGLFASENSTTPNGGGISRHIIFMTDGATSPSNSLYTPYGLEPLDQRRISGPGSNTNGNLTSVVNARLDSLCTAVKNKNITIWVVAFGTTLTSNLSSCASTGRAYQANNASELNTAFSEIAAEISQLRLTQ